MRTRKGLTNPHGLGDAARLPLSPILFNLVIDPLVHGPEDSGAEFEIAGEKISALTYANDIAFVTASPTSMGELLSADETARLLVSSIRASVQRCTLRTRESRSQRPSRWRDNNRPSWTKGTPTSILESRLGFALIRPRKAPYVT